MKKYILVVLVFGLLFSCKKDSDDIVPVEGQNSLLIDLAYEVDGQALSFDTLLYTNDAGSQYGVSRMWYYLSKIYLIKSDSSTVFLKDYIFVDAKNSAANQLEISAVPVGDYIGMKFNIGLDSSQNITGALPVTTDNLNMEWPVQMGGGYHFMKYEGHASDSTGNYGFAMHLGLNPYLVKCAIWNPIVVTAGTTNIRLVMNLNEWFRNPEIYDFNVDGNYSMGVMSAMIKLSQNGSDVFTIQ
ncbi:MAG: hypothetical protein EYC69_06630 [Bacteroidetes bacterium]|nr:MAG: hypothetical protein EYC69_06630 [Bacteroidota bacterium]